MPGRGGSGAARRGVFLSHRGSPSRGGGQAGFGGRTPVVAPLSPLWVREPPTSPPRRRPLALRSRRSSASGAPARRDRCGQPRASPPPASTACPARSPPRPSGVRPDGGLGAGLAERSRPRVPPGAAPHLSAGRRPWRHGNTPPTPAPRVGRAGGSHTSAPRALPVGPGGCQSGAAVPPPAPLPPVGAPREPERAEVPLGAPPPSLARVERFCAVAGVVPARLLPPPDRPAGRGAPLPGGHGEGARWAVAWPVAGEELRWVSGRGCRPRDRFPAEPWGWGSVRLSGGGWRGASQPPGRRAAVAAPLGEAPRGRPGEERRPPANSAGETVFTAQRSPSFSPGSQRQSRGLRAGPRAAAAGAAPPRRASRRPRRAPLRAQPAALLRGTSEILGVFAEPSARLAQWSSVLV